MDGLTLLSEGKAAGLTILADGDRLIISGPKSADAVARQLLAHKAVVMNVLRNWTSWEDTIDPPPLCPNCNGLELWQNPLGVWRCMVCDPPTKAQKLLERLEKVRARKSTFQNHAGCVLAALNDV
jgi:ribosomal protein L37AE/L43A